MVCATNISVHSCLDIGRMGLSETAISTIDKDNTLTIKTCLGVLMYIVSYSQITRD